MKKYNILIIKNKLNKIKNALITRKKIIRIYAVLFAVAITIFFMHMFFNAYKIKIRQITITSKDIPLSFNNKKIAFLSDTHIGFYVSEKQMKKIAALATKEKPDIILLGGDYIYSSPRTLRFYNFKNTQKIKNSFSFLKAPLGVYAVMGNHDNKESKQDISNALNSINIKMVDNQNVFITNKEGYIVISGFGDEHTDKINIETALENTQTNDFVIVIAHNPKSVRRLIKYDKVKNVDLFLSGHTHGGQIRFSPLGIIEKINKNKEIPSSLSYGIMNYKNSQMYVTSGTGVVLMPLRFFANAEIVIITLVRSWFFIKLAIHLKKLN